jgi:flagellar biosynthetic protein FliR
MDLRYLGENALLYFLLFARIIAVIEVAPLLSSSSVPQIAKVTLALMTALIVLPGVAESGYPIPENGLSFAFLVVGEAILGIIIGFFLVVIFTAFQVAGQFFSLQMGFGASEVYDPLAQIEIPLMGQYINLMACSYSFRSGGFRRSSTQASFSHSEWRVPTISLHSATISSISWFPASEESSPRLWSFLSPSWES